MNNNINIFDWEIFRKSPKKLQPATYERVCKLCVNRLGIPDNVTLSKETTKEDLWMDSLDEVELLMYTEEEFDIDISDEEWEKCNTVRDVVVLVEGKLSEG